MCNADVLSREQFICPFLVFLVVEFNMCHFQLLNNSIYKRTLMGCNMPMCKKLTYCFTFSLFN